MAYTLAAIKDWTFLLGPGWVVGWGNGLILGYMMYRTGLVPRALTWLGLVGGPLIIVAGTIVLLGGNPATSALKGPAPRRLLHHLGLQGRRADPVRPRLGLRRVCTDPRRVGRLCSRRPIIRCG